MVGSLLMALITVAAVWIRVSTVSLVVLTHSSMLFKEHRMHFWSIPVHCLPISAFHQYHYTQSKSGFSGIVCNESIGDHWYRINLSQPTQHRSIVPLMQTTYKSWSCKLRGKCVSSFYLRQKTIVHELKYGRYCQHQEIHPEMLHKNQNLYINFWNHYAI
jgi:hypothetical protein